jgi:hypothetical protein
MKVENRQTTPMPGAVRESEKVLQRGMPHFFWAAALD